MPNNDYIQDPAQIRRAKDYHAKALGMFDKGFTAEAHRKDALDYLNRAYDTLVIEALHYALWSQRTDDGDKWIWDNETAKDLDHNHNVPALHVWNKDKHGKLYAAYPAFVKIANVLRADRDAIKASPLISKPKSKTRAKAEERLADAKTCQICSRPILAERGKIAHHGYQRPHQQGFQTSSCFGALHLPFEVSRDRLGEYIVLLKGALEHTNTTRVGVADESIALSVYYGTGKYNGRHEIQNRMIATRATYDESRIVHIKQARWEIDIPKTFDDVKERELIRLDRDIHDQELYLVGQEIRFNDWKPVAV